MSNAEVTKGPLIRRVWDELREQVSNAIGYEIKAIGEGVDLEFTRATTTMAQIQRPRMGGGVTKLRVSNLMVTEDTHDLRVTLIHEMCHIPPSGHGHGPYWRTIFRLALDACGYYKHPNTRIHSYYDADAHPGMAQLKEFNQDVFEKKEGWMYFCNCLGKRVEDGGYGIRTRRSLDGRVCPRCGILDVKWVQ